MYTCEKCHEDTYGLVFDTPSGVMCEECFIKSQKSHMTDEEWDEMYNGSATELADLLNIIWWEAGDYAEARYEAIEEAKWEAWEDR